MSLCWEAESESRKSLKSCIQAISRAQLPTAINRRGRSVVNRDLPELKIYNGYPDFADQNSQNRLTCAAEILGGEDEQDFPLQDHFQR